MTSVSLTVSALLLFAHGVLDPNDFARAARQFAGRERPIGGATRNLRQVSQKAEVHIGSAVVDGGKCGRGPGLADGRFGRMRRGGCVKVDDINFVGEIAVLFKLVVSAREGHDE